MYMMNTMVVRKLLDGFKHMTYKIAQQTETMSTFQNLVWHELSNFRARYGQATASYKCNQGHVWIEHDMYIKTWRERMDVCWKPIAS